MRVLVWLLAAACAAAAQVTFHEHVRLVTAPTLVYFPDGRLAPDLHSTDFRLYDNGRPQKIAVEPASAPLSVALAVQTNLDVRAYVPFIARVGSVVETLLAGEDGETALVAYDSQVRTLKPFATGDLAAELHKLTTGGIRARAVDAGMQALRLLEDRPPARSRVLVFISGVKMP